MQSILIIRLSAIGDIVMASGLIESIRKKYPHSKIYWLAQPECKNLLAHHPDLQAVISWPKQEWKTLWQQKRYLTLLHTLYRFRRQLQYYQFDLAIDLQGLLKSGFLAWLSTAKKRVGLGSKEGSQYLMHQVFSREQGDVDLIGSEYRYLAEQLHLNSSPWIMRLGIDQSSEHSAKQLIKQYQLQQGFMIICPFTTRPQKHWFNEYWIQLVEKMQAKWQQPIILLGGPADKPMAAQIVEKTISPTLINLVGQTSLISAAALITRCRLLVGVDTGLTHMGHAYHVPTIALFGSTRPYLKTDSPYSQVIYHARDCSPCKRRPSCEGRFDCMRDITPDEVIKTAIPLVHAYQRPAHFGITHESTAY